MTLAMSAATEGFSAIQTIILEIRGHGPFLDVRGCAVGLEGLGVLEHLERLEHLSALLSALTAASHNTIFQSLTKEKGEKRCEKSILSALLSALSLRNGHCKAVATDDIRHWASLSGG